MATVPLNDLGRISADTLNAISSDIAQVLSSGWFLKGPHTAELERKLASRHHERPVLAVANGTDALYVALRSLEIGPGSHVATVANAGGYTTGVLTRLNATPVLVDVDRNSAQMSIESLTKAIETHSLDAVVVTHLYGLIGKVDEISALCARHNIPLLEDCAQAMGAVLHGSAAGTFGDIATTSFYPTKNLGAFGDGGAVICKDSSLFEKAASIAQYGWSDRYVVTTSGGINSRLDEIQAVVLLHLEPQLDSDNSQRRAIVQRYAESLSGSRRMIFNDSPKFIGHLAVMITDSRNSDAEQLGEHGIATGIHYPVPDHQQPAWTDLVLAEDLINTEWLAERTLTLPCFPEMTESEIEHVTKALAML